MTDPAGDGRLSGHLAEIACAAALQAGEYLMEQLSGPLAYEEKAGFYDPVTECDRQAERIIAENIFRRHPLLLRVDRGRRRQPDAGGGGLGMLG